MKLLLPGIILFFLVFGGAPQAFAQDAATRTAADSQPPSLAASPAIERATVQSFSGSAWQRLEGDAFVIYHRGRDETAVACGQLLTSTRDAFIGSLAAAGLRLADARPVLEWVVFGDRPAFDRYARAADRADASWMQGYYSAKTNRVALVVGGMDVPSTTVAALPQAEFDLDLASVTHEAAHQLAFNLGLQRRGVIYPLWVSEGLATNFESLWWDAPLGPLASNPYRQEQLCTAVATGRLLDLAELVTQVAPPVDDPAAIDAIYAQSWALFRFLVNDQPEQLQAYFAALADEPAHKLRPSRLAHIFRKTFGEPADLEDRWQAFVRRTLRDAPSRNATDGMIVLISDQ